MTDTANQATVLINILVFKTSVSTKTEVWLSYLDEWHTSQFFERK